jgi:hypothetical protein
LNCPRDVSTRSNPPCQWPLLQSAIQCHEPATETTDDRPEAPLSTGGRALERDVGWAGGSDAAPPPDIDLSVFPITPPMEPACPNANGSLASTIRMVRRGFVAVLRIRDVPQLQLRVSTLVSNTVLGTAADLGFPPAEQFHSAANVFGQPTAGSRLFTLEPGSWQMSRPLQISATCEVTLPRGAPQFAPRVADVTVSRPPSVVRGGRPGTRLVLSGDVGAPDISLSVFPTTPPTEPACPGASELPTRTVRMARKDLTAALRIQAPAFQSSSRR